MKVSFYGVLKPYISVSNDKNFQIIKFLSLTFRNKMKKTFATINKRTL